MMGSVEDYMEEDQLSGELHSRGQRQAYYFDGQEEEIDERRFLDVEEVKGKLPQWIREDETLKYIKIKFTKFLNHFKGDTNFPIYGTKIREMCISNHQSIEINYNHLK